MEIHPNVYLIQSIFGGRNLFQYLFVGENVVLVDTGIAETPGAEVRAANRLPTVVRGVLRLPVIAGIKPRATRCLLDACGRKVLDLQSGTNDVRGLAPGVYFVREEPQAAGHKHHAVRKIVLTD